jgi:hypothetical protein
MKSALLWGFFPDQAIPVLIVGGALISIVLGRRILGFVVPLVLTLFLAPFLEALVGNLPWWMTASILLVLASALLRGAVGLFLGARAAGHLVGALATDVVHWLLKAMVAIPVHLVRGLIRIFSWARNLEANR